MTFERTQDMAMVASIATHARIFPASSDDYSPRPEAYHPPDSELIWYVLVSEDGKQLGMFVFMPDNAVCYRTHVCLLPIAYGPRSSRAFREVTRWFFQQNVQSQRLVGAVPRFNTLAMRLAKLAGWKVYGVNPKSYMKGGKLHDLVLFGVSRSET